MTRISTPTEIQSAPKKSIPLLNIINAQLGTVPNMFRIISNSPAALEGYMGLNNSLAKSALDASTHERIALAVAELNGCDYCLAAHSYLAANVAKLNDHEIEANRRGSSTDSKAAVAVTFALDIVKSRGSIPDSSLSAVRNAGYSDAEIVEIIALVGLNTLTNYLNKALNTEIDFPAAEPLGKIAA